MAGNAGLINLTGGTYDNNGHALDNTGEISGYGAFRTGGLTTSGSVTFAGGTSTVNGSVTETSGDIDTYNPTIFTGAVSINGGIFTTHETQTTFAGGLNINGGAFNNDPGTMQTTNLAVAAGSIFTGGPDCLDQVSGNVSNMSTGFQLGTGVLELIAGSQSSHSFTWSVNSGIADIAALTIDSGQKVEFENGGNAASALHVLSFQWADGLGAAEPSSLQRDISNDFSGDLTIYYAEDSADTYLDDAIYTFGTGGLLEPEAVPEPCSRALIFGGIVLLLGAGRRRGLSAGCDEIGRERAEMTPANR
jgi:hypothetical protein